MASEKALYTVAVVVLALGLGNSLADSNPDWLRNLSDRSVATAEHLSGRAEQYLAMAQIVVGRGESNVGTTQAALGHVQARLGEVQANLARHQAEMVRVQAQVQAQVQAEDMRVLALQQVRQVRIACPRVVVQVASR